MYVCTYVLYKVFSRLILLSLLVRPYNNQKYIYTYANEALNLLFLKLKQNDSELRALNLRNLFACLADSSLSTITKEDLNRPSFRKYEFNAHFAFLPSGRYALPRIT